MKKIVSIITVLLAVLFVQAQTITQNGVSYRYNGKNPRTPIGGVYIKPVTADNGVVSNASNGSFSVVLKNLKMGSRIGNVKVAKQGMMVFNQQAVDEWNVRKDPLCLILCDANEFQKQKKKLIAIGERQAKKKYDKKLAELKKKNEAQQLQIDDYYNKLDSLEKEYQNALKHMDEYADVFARIDESEVDTLAQRAIELFNKGEIDESIHLFEQGNYMKNNVEVSLNETTPHNKHLPPLKDAIVTLCLDNETKTDTLSSLDNKALFANIPHSFIGKRACVKIECKDWLPVDTTFILTKNPIINIARNPECYGNVKFLLWNLKKEKGMGNVKVEIAGQTSTSDANGNVKMQIPLKNQREKYQVLCNLDLDNNILVMPTTQSTALIVKE